MNNLSYSQASIIGITAGIFIPIVYSAYGYFYKNKFISNDHYSKVSDFSPNDVCTIFQKQWGVTNASSIKPILSTINVGPCVVIAIFEEDISNSTFNKAALFHYDDNTKREDLKKILDICIEVFNFDLNALKVSLIGGWSKIPESKKLVDFIENFFTNINIKPNTDNLLSETNVFSVVGIDSRTGNILLLDKEINKATKQEEKWYYDSFDVEVYSSYIEPFIIAYNQKNIDKNPMYTQIDEIQNSGTKLSYTCQCYESYSKQYQDCMYYNDLVDATV